MKKFLAAILSLVYLFTVSGATVNLHYCMGEMTSASIWHSTQSKDCPNCGECKKDKCCKDVPHIVIIKKVHKPSGANFTFRQFEIVTPIYYVADTIVKPNTAAYWSQDIHAPPFIKKCSLFKLNCVFRI